MMRVDAADALLSRLRGRQLTPRRRADPALLPSRLQDRPVIPKAPLYLVLKCQVLLGLEIKSVRKSDLCQLQQGGSALVPIRFAVGDGTLRKSHQCSATA